MRRFPALAGLLLAAACATMEPPEPAGRVAPVPPGSTEPIRFDDLRLVQMRRGDEIGRYVFGIDCAPPYDSLYWTTGRNLHEQGTYEARFREALTEAGFDVAGAGGGTLDRDSDRKRARFAVSGELRDVRMELCRREHWLTGASRGESGQGTARVDWSVHRIGDGRLVHRATTTGTAMLDHGVPQGRILLVEEAFLDAALKLAADPAFRGAVARPGVVLGGPVPAADSAPPAAPAPVSPEPSAPTALRPADKPDASTIPIAAAAPAGPVAARDDALTGAILQVGHGRGVTVGVVDGGSLILATAAAAGNADTVSVRPARGVTLDGTVERRDALLGLVLVRVPARLTALPPRPDPPAVSEPVRAASKGGTALSPGIVARMEPNAGDAQAPEPGLADLAGAVPAAGDPLLDEAGRLVGIVLAALANPGPARQGLTPFVAAGAALARLGVELRRTDGAPADAAGRGGAPFPY